MPYVKQDGQELWFREDVYAELLKNCQRRAWILGLSLVSIIFIVDFVATSFFDYQQSVSWADVILGAVCCTFVWGQIWRVRRLEQLFSGYPTRASGFIPPSEEVDKKT